MDFVFADDSRQRKPSRRGMRPLVAVGGVCVPDGDVQCLENTLDDLCVNQHGFPPGEPFKWSPDRGMWMHTSLLASKRQEFFLAVLAQLREHDVRAVVVVSDTRTARATDASTPEEDVLLMFLERVQKQLQTPPSSRGVVIADRPQGGKRDRNRFLANCAEALRVGTSYVRFENVALSVITTPMRLIRCLQAADVVTSCTLARIAGEQRFSPPIFQAAKVLFRRQAGRIGGAGLKIHPDLRYANLYHWLLGDCQLVRGNMAVDLPTPGYPYAEDEWTA